MCQPTRHKKQKDETTQRKFLRQAPPSRGVKGTNLTSSASEAATSGRRPITARSTAAHHRIVVVVTVTTTRRSRRRRRWSCSVSTFGSGSALIDGVFRLGFVAFAREKVIVVLNSLFALFFFLFPLLFGGQSGRGVLLFLEATNAVLSS